MSIQSAFDPKGTDRAFGGIGEQAQIENYKSPTWQRAIDRYYEELRTRGVKGPTIDHDVWSIHSPDDLLQRMNDFVSPGSGFSGQWAANLRRLEPILLKLNDLAAVITLALGMKGQVATVIWGSIGITLKLARPVLPALLDIFEELARALPGFRIDNQRVSITSALGEALVATYTEIVVFCAHSIAFFRNNPNLSHNTRAWSRFSNDISKVIVNIRHYSRVVDETADTVLLSRQSHSANTINAMC